MISKIVKVYIDDIIVKMQDMARHLSKLKVVFERICVHQLKMNPLKCAFRVTIGNFLGFLVHKKEIEVDKNKARVIIEAAPLRTKKKLQRLIGQINFIRQYIASCIGKVQAFSPLLNLKGVED